VAIGRRFRYQAVAEIARRTGTIVGHDILFQRGLQSLGDQATHGIRGAAGWKRQNETQRFRGIRGRSTSLRAGIRGNDNC